jgi:hypothetical protein
MQKDSTDFNSIVFYTCSIKCHLRTKKYYSVERTAFILTAETVKDIHLAGRSIGTFLNDVRGIFTIFNY